MKRISIFLVGFFFLNQLGAQKLNPVKWNYEAIKTAEKQYNIVLTADVASPWHIYSQFVKKGPVPTTIQFNVNPLVQIKGTPKEIGNLEKKFDKNFGAVIGSFGGKVQFVQSVVLKVPSKTRLSGTIEYMVCNEEKCLPPTKLNFEVEIQ